MANYREQILLPLCPSYAKFMDSLILLYCEAEDQTLLVNNSVPLEGWYRRNMLGEFRKRGSQRLYKHVAKTAKISLLVYEEFQRLLITLHQAWGCEYINGCDQQSWADCLQGVEKYLDILRPGLWTTVKESGLLESMQDSFHKIKYQQDQETHPFEYPQHTSNYIRSSRSTLNNATDHIVGLGGTTSSYGQGEGECLNVEGDMNHQCAAPVRDTASENEHRMARPAFDSGQLRDFKQTSGVQQQHSASRLYRGLEDYTNHRKLTIYNNHSEDVHSELCSDSDESEKAMSLSHSGCEAKSMTPSNRSAMLAVTPGQIYAIHATVQSGLALAGAPVVKEAYRVASAKQSRENSQVLNAPTFDPAPALNNGLAARNRDETHSPPDDYVVSDTAHDAEDADDNNELPANNSGNSWRADQEVNRIKQRFGINVLDESVNMMD